LDFGALALGTNWNISVHRPPLGDVRECLQFLSAGGWPRWVAGILQREMAAIDLEQFGTFFVAYMRRHHCVQRYGLNRGIVFTAI
jgi:hypothetical protein